MGFARNVRAARLGPLLALAAVICGERPAAARSAQSPSHSWCGTHAGRAASALFGHREQEGRLGPPIRAAGAQVTPATDQGQIAVLKDDGDLILFRNFFDLQGKGLEFRTDASSVSVARVDRPVAA